MKEHGNSRRFPVLTIGLALAAAAMLFIPLAGASSPPTLTLFGPWATAGSQLVFVANAQHKSALWSEKFGSSALKRIAPAYCAKGMEEADQLAVGPKGSTACLEATMGVSESFFKLAYVSSAGKVKQVATAGGPAMTGSPPTDSIPIVFGDGSFLGYLHVTADGVVQLMRIGSTGSPSHVADLNGLSNPTAVSIDSGHIAVTQGGSVFVYATSGQQVSTFAAKAAAVPSVAIRKDRVVVRTTDKRLVVYTLTGQQVHSYPLGATAHANGLATYGGYAVYLAAGKAVRAVKLTSGRDRIVARSGAGWFFNNVSIQSPGVVAPLTSPGSSVPVKLLFIPMAKIRAAVG